MLLTSAARLVIFCQHEENLFDRRIIGFRCWNCRVGSSGVHLPQKRRSGTRRAGARDRKPRKDGNGACSRFDIVGRRGGWPDRSWREKPQLVDFCRLRLTVGRPASERRLRLDRKRGRKNEPGDRLRRA
jgi:hypothetical protein